MSESIKMQTNLKAAIAYDHSRLERRRKVLRFLIRFIGFNFLAKVDTVEGLENIPAEGPAILMMNHIAFIDSLLVVSTAKRNVVPLAKKEVYDYPVVGIFPRLWGVVPVRRGEFDRKAVQQIMAVLDAGEIVLVAPEGTRGMALGPAKEGVAYMAARSGAPVVPVALNNTNGFPALRFTARWRGPGATLHYGKPFRFKPEYRRARSEQLRVMINEAMYVLAALLPPERRGLYSDLSSATTDTIEWLNPQS